MTPQELRDEIDAAVRDYRLTYPEPWPLSPNLRLMVAARGEMDRLVEVCDSWGQNYDSWVAAAHEAEEAQRKAEARADEAEKAVRVLRRLVPERDSHGQSIDKYIKSLNREGE